MRRDDKGRFMRRKTWLVTELHLYESPWYKEEKREEIEIIAYLWEGMVIRRADGTVEKKLYGRTDISYTRDKRWFVLVEPS